MIGGVMTHDVVGMRNVIDTAGKATVEAGGPVRKAKVATTRAAIMSDLISNDRKGTAHGATVRVTRSTGRSTSAASGGIGDKAKAMDRARDTVAADTNVTAAADTVAVEVMAAGMTTIAIAVGLATAPAAGTT